MDQNTAHKLLDCLAREKGIQNLMVLASEQLKGRSTILVNASNRIIAYAATEKVSSTELSSQLHQGFINESTYSLLKKESIFKRLNREKSILTGNDTSHLNFYWLMSAVRVNDVPVAYFVSLDEHTDFDNSDLQNAEEILLALEIMLIHDSQFTVSSMHTEGMLLNELLHDSSPSEADILTRMRIMGLPIFHAFRLFVIEKKGSHENESDIVLQSVVDTIAENNFKDYLYTICQNQIILVLNNRELETTKAESLSYEIAELAGSLGLQIGISNPFYKITQMKLYFEQAQTALCLGKIIAKEKAVYLYSVYSIYHLLQNTTVRLQDLCHPVLYDMYKNGSAGDKENLNTVFLYLREMKSAAKAAEQLNIHKNTLFYRVNKVTEQARLNLNNGADVFQIMLTDKILQMANVQYEL